MGRATCLRPSRHCPGKPGNATLMPLSRKTWKCKQTLTSFGMCESSVDLVKLVYLACEIGKTGKIVNSVNILEIARILNIMKTMLCRNDW